MEVWEFCSNSFEFMGKSCMLICTRIIFAQKNRAYINANHFRVSQCMDFQVFRCCITKWIKFFSLRNSCTVIAATAKNFNVNHCAKYTKLYPVQIMESKKYLCKNSLDANKSSSIFYFYVTQNLQLQCQKCIVLKHITIQYPPTYPIFMQIFAVNCMERKITLFRFCYSKHPNFYSLKLEWNYFYSRND